MSKKIGVLGCGWLGLPLASQLVADGFEVFGTTTTSEKIPELKQKGIIPFQVALSENGIDVDMEGFLSELDILVINVPPKLRGGNAENYVRKMQHLHTALKKTDLKHLIFVSSTSVYGDLEGEITEETVPEPTTESGTQLLESEDLFRNDTNLKATIIRFGGLIGPDRHPVTLLSKKQNLSGGNDAINLIHLEDCIHLITTIISEGYWGEIFNGVYPDHPQKKDYYTKEAQKRGLPLPDYVYEGSGRRGKVVVSKNFMEKKHTFRTPIAS
ncbi:MAG: SDR family oxidoreductase [Allomuricauda sp.]